MNKEEAELLQGKFQALSYKGRLNYWDENGINFMQVYEKLHEEIMINIQPYQLADRILYNKWVIRHWQKKLRENPDLGGSKSSEPLRALETYLRIYKQQVAIYTKEEVCYSELDRISKFIVAQGVRRSIIRNVIDSVQWGLEDELYAYKVYPSLKYFILKDVAKILDPVKYLIFLRQEKRLLKSNKRAAFDNFKDLDNQEIEGIYNDLIKHNFITDDTDKQNFMMLFKNMELDPNFHITWIDIAHPSKDGNKVTLITFIHFLSPFINDTEEKNTVMINHFLIKDKKGVKPIVRGSLNKSWLKLRAPDRNKSEREILIVNIVKKWLKD